MKKMLAALLAVCMLLTMLPISVFAAETTTILDIQYDEENDDVMVYDGNGEPIIPHSEGGYHYWVEDTWAFYTGVLLLSDGTFKVTSDIPLQMMIVNMGVTLIDGDLSAYNVLNGGTISGGTISVERMNAEMYDINFEPGSFFNLGTISGKANIDCIAFQNGGEMNFSTAPSMLSADTMEFSAVINGANIAAEEFYNYGTISNSVIDCDYFQNGYTYDPGDVCVADVFDDVSNDVCIIKNSTLNSSMIVNEAYAIFDHVDCDNQAVHAQLYDEILGEPEVDEYRGTLTWDTVVADKLDMLGYIRNGYSYGEYVGEMDCAAEWTCTEKDALDKYTWKWPSADWFAEMPQPQPQSMMVYDEDSYPEEMKYYGFTVPSGYKLSIEENDFVLHKEEPKPPVIEEEIEKETYDIVVRVKFDGVDEDEIDFVNAQLLKNGKAYKKAVKVDAKDEWRHEWTDLDDSSKIEWTVTADEIEGYNMKIENVRANYWTITLSKGAVEKANPETGADDFVGAAVALAVCSAACGAVLSLKK